MLRRRLRQRQRGIALPRTLQSQAGSSSLCCFFLSFFCLCKRNDRKWRRIKCVPTLFLEWYTLYCWWMTRPTARVRMIARNVYVAGRGNMFSMKITADKVRFRVIDRYTNVRRCMPMSQLRSHCKSYVCLGSPFTCGVLCAICSATACEKLMISCLELYFFPLKRTM